MKISQISPTLFIKSPSQYETNLIQSIQFKLEMIDFDDLPTTEQVISKVVTLIKQEITNFEGQFGVLSINGRSGMVELAASDLGAEPSFSKRTAFNRSFGQTASTVCEGNDPRLSDERTPTEHHHDVMDIEGFQNAVGMNEKLLGLESDSHRHHNARILDLLMYNGAQNQIDLSLLDQIIDFSQEDITDLKAHERNGDIHVTSEQKTTWDNKETLIGAQQKVSQALEDAKSYSDTGIQQLKTQLVSGASNDYATLKAIELIIKERIIPNLASSDNNTWESVQNHLANDSVHLTTEQRDLISAIPSKASVNHEHEMIRYKTFTTVDDLF